MHSRFPGLSGLTVAAFVEINFFFLRNFIYLTVSALLSRMLIDLIYHLIDNSNTFSL